MRLLIAGLVTRRGNFRLLEATQNQEGWSDYPEGQITRLAKAEGRSTSEGEEERKWEWQNKRVGEVGVNE